MAGFTYSNNLTNGSTVDATKVMQNFNDVRRFVNGDAGAANMDAGNMASPYIHWHMVVESMLTGLGALGAGAAVNAWWFRNGPTPFYVKSWYAYVGTLGGGAGTFSFQQSPNGAAWTTVGTPINAATGDGYADLEYTVPANHYLKIVITDGGAGGLALSPPIVFGIRCRSTLSNVV
jgi:hypothetical protein